VRPDDLVRELELAQLALVRAGEIVELCVLEVCPRLLEVARRLLAIHGRLHAIRCSMRSIGGSPYA
jgi:hypothetical protein